MKAVILAAGLGRRLGKPYPKALIEMPNGKTLLENQISILRDLGIKEIIVVVGFKKEIIMERFPEVLYVYNPYFGISNTAFSLRLALEQIKDDDIIWINGDVYFENKVLQRALSVKSNCVVVNKALCGEEEVKYSLDSSGRRVTSISKELTNYEGEALGINKVQKEDFAKFLFYLKKCSSDDYFERAMDLAIKAGDLEFLPVDVSDLVCFEIDFEEDLDFFKKGK